MGRHVKSMCHCVLYALHEVRRGRNYRWTSIIDVKFQGKKKADSRDLEKATVIKGRNDHMGFFS